MLHRTSSQKPLSGAWTKVQGHVTAQLQLSNQSPAMCLVGTSVMENTRQNAGCASGAVAQMLVTTVHAPPSHLSAAPFRTQISAPLVNILSL
jgi:hypothetical protein